ncbi:MAG: ComEA family DNA-binding protein [Candidatus Ornithomonoglobus sp.]
MRIELRGKAKVAAVIAAFVAVVGGGLLLERLNNDRFVIEAVPGNYNGTDAEAEETKLITDGESAEPAVSVEKRENTETEAAAAPVSETEPEAEMVIDGKININTATVEVLMQLDGIGESTAEKIVDYREAHDGFTDVHELTEVSGIGEKKLEAIIDKICVK